MRPSSPDGTPRPAPDPYVVGLRLLGVRELSGSQLAARLSRRGYGPDEAASAVERLKAEGALDDRRVAVARARAAQARGRARARALREVEALGIARDVARAAVDEVFEAVDEDVLLERALARRLEGPIQNRAHFRRLYQQLLRQGFSPDRILALLRRRGAAEPDEPGA